MGEQCGLNGVGECVSERWVGRAKRGGPHLLYMGRPFLHT